MKRCPECRRDYYDDTLLYVSMTELRFSKVRLPPSQRRGPIVKRYRREWSHDGKRLAFVLGSETSDAVMITDFR